MKAYFYNSNEPIEQYDIVLGKETDENVGITHNKAYVVRACSGEDLIVVENDFGELDHFSTEYFKKDNGECME